MAESDVYLTRSQAALYLGVSTNVVKHWHDRGWLAPDGRGGVQRRRLRTRPTSRGWLTYHLADLVAAERDTRRSVNSRRRPSTEAGGAVAA